MKIWNGYLYAFNEHIIWQLIKKKDLHWSPKEKKKKTGNRIVSSIPTFQITRGIWRKKERYFCTHRPYNQFADFFSSVANSCWRLLPISIANCNFHTAPIFILGSQTWSSRYVGKKSRCGQTQEMIGVNFRWARVKRLAVVRNTGIISFI